MKCHFQIYPSHEINPQILGALTDAWTLEQIGVETHRRNLNVAAFNRAVSMEL
jgi:hypothetical protein